jgi:hypothetical protein
VATKKGKTKSPLSFVAVLGSGINIPDPQHLLTISPLRSALPIQDVNIHKANGIGGKNRSAPIGQADQISRMNNQTNETLRIFWGSIYVTYSKSQLDAPIY